MIFFFFFFFFSSRRRHTRFDCDWSSDVCSSDLISQYDRPLAEKGSLPIGEKADGTPIRVGITRLHLEEDAGKSIHDRFPGATRSEERRVGKECRSRWWPEH